MAEKKKSALRTHKTFGLRHPRDYFEKLKWEVECLQRLPRTDDHERAYQMMNCASTAWHLTEWVYSFMSDPQRGERQHEALRLTGYQNWIRKQSDALHVCRLIATASKHVQVTQHDDDDISTDHLELIAPGDRKRFKSEPAILIKGHTWFPEQVMELVVEFWRDELTRLGLFVDQSPWGNATRNEKR